MNTITPTTSSTAQAANQARAAAAAEAQNEGVLSSDFETFLNMLSVQMKNQDPLNPTDSTEFASQLAQFSTVEQQTLTNKLLQNMSSQFTSNDLSSLSTWVGMEARVAAPANFSGSAIEVAPNANTSADSAFLIVRDSDGTEVQRYAIDPKKGSVTWSGIDDAGNVFEDGLYTFVTESYANGEKLDLVYADTYARVSEARMTDKGVMLSTQDGIEFSSDDVIALREPKAS